MEKINRENPNATNSQQFGILYEKYLTKMNINDPKQWTQERTQQISKEPPNPQPPKKESSGLFGGIFSRKKDSNIDPAVYENTQAKIDNVSQDSPLVDQYDRA